MGKPEPGAHQRPAQPLAAPEPGLPGPVIICSIVADFHDAGWPKVCPFRHMGSASRASRCGVTPVTCVGSQLGGHREEPNQWSRVRRHVEHAYRHWRSRGCRRAPLGLSMGSVSQAWTFASLRGRADRSVTEGNRLF